MGLLNLFLCISWTFFFSVRDANTVLRNVTYIQQLETGARNGTVCRLRRPIAFFAVAWPVLFRTLQAGIHPVASSRRPFFLLVTHTVLNTRVTSWNYFEEHWDSFLLRYSLSTFHHAGTSRIASAELYQQVDTVCSTRGRRAETRSADVKIQKTDRLPTIKIEN